MWERGVGETSASGTSAVAVALATHGDGEVIVSFPGGDLWCGSSVDRAWLTGPAAARVTPFWLEHIASRHRHVENS